jgi:hypothetical protein
MDVGITTEKLRLTINVNHPIIGLYRRASMVVRQECAVCDIQSMPYWTELDIDLGLGSVQNNFHLDYVKLN